jgi:hypothetical protein
MQSATRETGLKEVNLEHVYPISPKHDEWGGEAGQAVLNEYLWHLGNLTIYGTRINRTASNDEYAKVKRAQYQQKSQVVMTLELAQTYSDWNADTIVDRASKLAKSVVEVWNFDNPSRV